LVSYEHKTYASDTIEQLLILAKNIEYLINNNFCSKEPEWFYRQYKTLLIEKNFAKASGQIKQKRLIDDFIFFYGREMLSSVDSLINYDDENNWLISIARKHRKSFHPIRHLLLIKFLTNSVEEFFQKDYEYKPFGDAPWLCLNAAAEHYLKPAVTKLVIGYCLENKKPLGTFSCSCGMVYSRSGSDESHNDKLRIGKIIQFGSVWESKLKELVEIQKLGLRETARHLHVDPRTICRYVSKLNLKTYWKTTKENYPAEDKAISSSLDSFVQVEYQQRKAWIALQHQHPEVSKTNLRKLAPAIYIWLYRNDLEWLNQNSPILQKPISSVAKVD
jgi:hypothetical protein